MVARRGLIWLQAGANGGEPLFSRLVRALSFMSQSIDLPPSVRLRRRLRSEEGLIILKPPGPGVSHLSAFYDVAAAAARLVGGQLYIGRRDALVRYRDDRAPRGYDVPELLKSAVGEAIVLVDRWGSRLLSRSELLPIRLADFCLQVGPVPACAGPLPRQLYAMTPRALHGIVGRYLRAHHLHYQVASVRTSSAERLLFQIGPRPDAPAGQAVPRFVIDYLSRLPRVMPLLAVSPPESPRFLVQWQHRYPLALPHVAGAFARDELVVLSAAPEPALRIRPAPVFVDGDLLTTGYVSQPAPLRFQGAAVDVLADLQVPILLRPDNGSVPLVAALFLDPAEVSWLRRLLYRLPGDAFAAYSLCRVDKGTVLLGGDRAVEGIPFGLPLRRVSGTNLFIPLRQRLVPLLPWELLARAFGLREDCYTILIDDHRLDMPMTGFVPMARAVLAQPQRPRVEIRITPPAALPEPAWRPAPALAAGTDADRPALVQAEELQTKPASADPRSAVVPGGDLDLGALLRGQARTYEAADDFLAAVVCYSLLNDEGNRARCYRRASTTLYPERD
ncbi:MAG TPA: hypothetical protein VK395_02090 [Gemmataceae bacterium]|nr:hypothetical protein [Gemmataceae bacterium]